MLARFRTRRRDDPAASLNGTRSPRDLTRGILRASLESGVKRGTASMGNGLDVGLVLNATSRRPRGVATEYALDA